MIIKKIYAENYKSFYEKSEIELEPGFNIFIGKNNSGKSTALELLDFNITLNNPHKSAQNIPDFKSIENTKTSTCNLLIGTTIEELKKAVNGQLSIPLPDDILKKNPGIGLQEIYNRISAKEIEIYFQKNESGIKVCTKTEFGYSKYLDINSTTTALSINSSIDSKIPELGLSNRSAAAITIFDAKEKLSSSLYRFSPIRTPKPTYGTTYSPSLLPNAENISQCINSLQSENATAHAKLCQLVHQIFPDIEWIQSPLNPNNAFELQCLPHKDRSDLAKTIDHMGTGVGNVISILYAIISARLPKTIAIDEPNSFLHPKALRELLQILQTHGKEHQYVLTGHSAEILTAIDSATIFYFDLENGATKIKKTNKTKMHEIRSELSDLGIRMTDLHARDRVLWVEGQTEEIIFPRLLREFTPEIAAGTAILRVTNTGQFEQKRLPPDQVAEAYNRLTSESIVPPLVTILLDRELRDENETLKLTEKSKIIKILPLRMIENYVIDKDAIFNILKLHNSDTSIEEISSMIPEPIDRLKIDGAKLLRKIFSDSMPVTIDYKKTTHTIELFNWLLDNKPQALEDLKLFIQLIFKEQ